MDHTFCLLGLYIACLTGIASSAYFDASLKWKSQWENDVHKQARNQEQTKENTDWVKKVHIVSMNHLDVGYDGIPESGFINNVLHFYFHEYFPRALKVGYQLRQQGYVESFIYTTHPWLVSMYMDCPPNFVLGGIKLLCPNTKEKAAFVQGVKDGIITWHAAPLNMEPEFAPSPEIFSLGLDIGFDLDKRFGIERKTRVMSQRDVPGLTQTVIPLLVQKGIHGLTVGVNPMSAPPGFPKIFRWNYNGSEVVAMWHPGGYPDQAGTVPTSPGGISRNDCVVIPDFPEALCFAFRNDNQGPPLNVEEVLGQYEVLRAEFPNAELGASKYEDFLMAVQPIKDKLPVYKNEVGDTWVFGVASDPKKSAQVRAVGRVMKDCYRLGKCDPKDNRVWNSSRIFVKTFEHTWGMVRLNDHSHWSNEQLAKVRSSKDFKNREMSWVEQRKILDYSIQALQNHSVANSIQAELSKLEPVLPDLSNFEELKDKHAKIGCPIGFNIQFGSDGALNTFQYNGIDWASESSSLGQFVYQSYNETDFKGFSAGYDYSKRPVVEKTNVTSAANPMSHTWPVTLVGLYSNKATKCDMYVHLQMANNESTTYYGAPSDVWIRYTVRSNPMPGMDVTLTFINKTTTRLPEAMTFQFSPTPIKNSTWIVSKLGGWVDPYSVILNGSQYQHVVDDDGIIYQSFDGKTGLRFRTPDVPLVILSAGQSPPKSAFPFPLSPVKERFTTVGFNLYNNIWNTNYIFWYPYLDEDRNFKARFSIDII